MVIIYFNIVNIQIINTLLCENAVYIWQFFYTNLKETQNEKQN